MPNPLLNHRRAATAKPIALPAETETAAESEIVLATIQARLNFTEACKEWLAQAQEHQLWLARNGGKHFFIQFRSTWETKLVEACEPVVGQYFRNRSFPPDALPQVKIRESQDLWMITAAVALKTGNGNGAKLDRQQQQGITAGLAQLQTKLDTRFNALANQKAHEYLCFPTVEKLLPPPPLSPFVSTIQIG